MNEQKNNCITLIKNLSNAKAPSGFEDEAIAICIQITFQKKNQSFYWMLMGMKWE